MMSQNRKGQADNLVSHHLSSPAKGVGDGWVAGVEGLKGSGLFWCTLDVYAARSTYYLPGVPALHSPPYALTHHSLAHSRAPPT
jgi:hypothetical protein